VILPLGTVVIPELVLDAAPLLLGVATEFDQGIAPYALT
jgi:hypothetical protein